MAMITAKVSLDDGETIYVIALSVAQLAVLGRGPVGIGLRYSVDGGAHRIAIVRGAHGCRRIEKLAGSMVVNLSVGDVARLRTGAFGTGLKVKLDSYWVFLARVENQREIEQVCRDVYNVIKRPDGPVS